MPKLPETFRDPMDLKTAVPAPPGPDWRLAVGLDLGTRTGVAATRFVSGRPWSPDEAPVFHCLWDLSARDFDSGAGRMCRLEALLGALAPDIVFYERVRHTPRGGEMSEGPTQAAARITSSAQLLGAFMAVVGLWCETRNVPNMGVTIGDIKKCATGRGNADKDAVTAACDVRFHTRFVDNGGAARWGDAADAAFCLAWGLERFTALGPV